MAGPTTNRSIGDLTFQEIGAVLRASSILCLPMGSMEQHGPHLPLNTDTVLADAFTRRIVERWGETYDLWLAKEPALHSEAAARRIIRRRLTVGQILHSSQRLPLQ